MDLTSAALTRGEPRRRRLARWLLAALVLSVAAPASAQAAGARSTEPVFGLVDARLLQGSADQVQAELAQDKSVGVTAVRVQLSWNAVEPEPGTYAWQPFDTVVRLARSEHMTVLGLVVFTPSWARPAGCRSWTCPPAHPQQFAAFVGDAAARYGTAVAAWEIWNEPNTAAFWSPRPDPAAYSSLLSDSAAAIHAADPSAVVVSGGLATVATDPKNVSATSYLASVCADGGLRSVDAVGVHPYSFPVPPDYPAEWNGWQQLDDTPVSVRSVMTRCGVGSLPVWITEYGAPTSGPGVAASPDDYNLVARPDHVTPALQAEMLAQAVRDADSDSWIGALFVYSAQDTGTSMTTNQESFGLLTPAGVPKPAWSSLRTALADS